MVRIVLLGVLVVFGTIVSMGASNPQTPTDLGGTYKCDGINPDGSAYQGLVEIARVNDTYRVRWDLANDVSVMGVGIMSNGVFAVSYFGGTPAVVVYKIDGRRLVGEWTMGAAEGAVYAETLTKMAAGDPKPRLPQRERRPASDVQRLHEVKALTIEPHVFLMQL